MNVLIVDDSRPKVAEVITLLAEVGVGRDAIDVAQCGQEARERLAKKKYELLILDLLLPLRAEDQPDRRGGMALLNEIIRGARLYQPANVLALTGFSELRAEFDSKYTDGLWAIDVYDPSESGWRDRLRARASYIRQSAAAPPADHQLDICIVTALDTPELAAVRRIPWNWQPPEIFDAVSYCYRGHFCSEKNTFSVAAISAPRMGMVAAATLSTKIIQKMRPRLLTMLGVCAGIRSVSDIGDVIVGDPSWDWQMGKYTQETFEIAPDQIGAPLELTQKFNLLKDDRKFLFELAEAFEGTKPNRVPEIIVGPMASGSSVLADSASIDVIKKQHRKLVAVEMESYGIYSAARDASPPRPLAVAIKGVCDLADPYKNDKFQRFAAHMSSGVLLQFASKYSDEILGKGRG